MTERIMIPTLFILAAACADETGTVEVSISGEEAAVDGWPVGDVGFVDGWSMDFTTLVVNVGEVELRSADGETAAIEVDDALVDLHQGDRVLYTLDAVGARRWDDVRYRLRPPTDASVDFGPIDPAVRAQMIAQGWSVYLEATATKGDQTRTLAWGLDMNVLNARCVAGDGTDGLVVATGGVTEAQLTLHWDHLFFDSLVLDEAEMRFDAMAAVAEPDGSVPLDALDAQRLADLRDAAGDPLVDADGEPVVYDPGSEALPEPTLFHHVRSAATTVGHFQGEGHCDYVIP